LNSQQTIFTLNAPKWSALLHFPSNLIVYYAASLGEPTQPKKTIARGPNWPIRQRQSLKLAQQRLCDNFQVSGFVLCVEAMP
jgi:hypothetical protein